MDSFTQGGGLIFQGVSGENLAAYSVVYVAGDGRWYMADANVPTSVPTLALTCHATTSGQLGRLLVKGLIQNMSWTWTPGQYLYLSAVAGAMTQTNPAAAGVRVQIVGGALSATLIYFDVAQTSEVESMLDYEVQTGIIAEPSTASKGNGHTVIVHNETEERDFVWSRTDLDTKWSGVELL